MASSTPGSGIAEPVAPALAPPAVPHPVRARRWRTLRHAARARLAPFGAAVLLVAVAAALLAPLVAPHDPLKQDLNRALGRLAGYAGGRIDGLVMRLMDAVLSFPPLVLALALGAVLGAGLTGVVIALGVVYTPTFARLMRGQVLTITAREYVEAARALGAPGWRIAWHHVLPNAMAPIVIQASLSVAFAILAEASLSFLGLGIQPPGASWGSMINAGRGYLQQAPWIVFGPGTALFLTVVGLNFVGDAIRDGLDPRLRG